jgi:hypothetical protein
LCAAHGNFNRDGLCADCRAEEENIVNHAEHLVSAQ